MKPLNFQRDYKHFEVILSLYVSTFVKLKALAEVLQYQTVLFF